MLKEPKHEKAYQKVTEIHKSRYWQGRAEELQRENIYLKRAHFKNLWRLRVYSICVTIGACLLLGALVIQYVQG